MQLDPQARLPQHPARGQRVQRQGHRAAGVINGQAAPPGLVVHDDQLGGWGCGGPGGGSRRHGSRRHGPAVQPVDAAGERNELGAGGDGALHPGGLGRGVQAGHVGLHQLAGPGPLAGGLHRVGEPVGQPAAFQQVPGGRHGAPGQWQPPPAGQGVVHAGPHAVVRPGRPLRRLRAVQVRHPVPARAVQPVGQPGRGARVQPPRHALETELFHRRLSPPRNRPQQNAPWGRPTPRSRSSSPPARP